MTNLLISYLQNGYVHVILRQLPPSEEDPPGKVRVELSVFDTGRGISQNFLKVQHILYSEYWSSYHCLIQNQLFHPFSQENPLQTGTGLGLAIVSSIITSENVGGKVDVWSEEGVGTEIKVIFPAEVPQVDHDLHAPEVASFRTDESSSLPRVSLHGFSSTHKGVQLLNETLQAYLTTWWGFEVVDEGDIVITNDDPTPIIAATKQRDTSRSFIMLSAARGSPLIMSIASEHERIGGFCRILYKPGGPSRLREILKLSVHALKIGQSRGVSPLGFVNGNGDSTHGSVDGKERSVSGSTIFRRNSEEAYIRSRAGFKRPDMAPRSSTAHPISSWKGSLPASKPAEVPDKETPMPTISLDLGGTLLKSSLGTLHHPEERRFRVLVVEDNSILRNLL